MKTAGIIFGLSIIAIVIAIGFTRWLFAEASNRWTLSSAEDYLGVELPVDSSDVFLDGHSGYGGYLTLRFSAPPMSAINFANRLCSDGLNVGFDPFNAIYQRIPTNNAILIKGNTNAIYAYSENTPNSLLGTNCESQRGMTYYLTVDISTSDSYFVHFEIPDYNTHFFDITGPNSRGSTPIQGSGFPLLVIGILEIDGVYTQVHQEVCLEARQPGFFLGWGNYRQGDLTPFFGASVEISVDSIHLPDARITATGNSGLYPINDETINGEPLGLWHYCFEPEWEAGNHIMDLSVTTTSGERYAYSWAFNVP